MARRFFRRLLQYCMMAITSFTMRATINGLENLPRQGPALIVSNHQGDADIILFLAVMPSPCELIMKIENRDDHWLVGPIFRAYGGLWIHRGRPDRRALRAALDALAENRIVTVAPEGRQTLTGGLEEGTDGAAFLALKSGAPIIPIAMTGTPNSNTYGSLKKLRRASVTLTVGKPFLIEQRVDHRTTIRDGTRQIMESIARLLPERFRGKYNYIS